MDYLAGDFLIRLKNASMARKRQVTVPMSAFNLAIARLLRKMGILALVKLPKNKLKPFTVEVNYYQGVNSKPVLADVKLFSKPGRRYYASASELPFSQGKGLVVVSTPKGIMTASQARKINVGGEVIAVISIN